MNASRADLVLKEKYPFACYSCGHEQTAAPSLFMELKIMNSGGGNCLKCGAYMHLKISESGNGDHMISSSLEDFRADDNDVGFDSVTSLVSEGNNAE